MLKTISDMKARSILHLSIGLLLSLLASAIAPGHRPAQLSYRILPSSQLFLEGTTNINTFTCNCTCVQSSPRLRLELEERPDGQRVVFDNAQLDIRTKDIDCGNRNMNKDLHQTLRADEYPSIGIIIEEASLKKGLKLIGGPDWRQLTSRALLTVAGTTRTVQLEVKARKTGPEAYRFISRYTIKMTDFNIDPPTAMLGLVKVNDQIEINFDLAIAAEEVK